jgi:hypothetical protein
MTLGRASEISRDEVKFGKFVSRLRLRFSQLFLKALEKQLVLKKVILVEEWPEIARRLKFDFAVDNHFAELKNLEIMTNRAAVLQAIEPYIGRAVSWKWARKNILMQTEEDMEQIDAEIAEEAEMEQYMNPELKLQTQMMELMPEVPEEDPNLGAPIPGMGQDDADAEAQEGNLGKPMKPPAGKFNGKVQPANAVRGKTPQAKQGTQTKKPANAKKATKPQGK